MKAVMYHYVRPVCEPLVRLRALHIEDFRKQLDHFATKYGFVEKQAFLAALDGGPIPSGIVLTFDDGLKDHYRWVLPELVKRGLWGIFYIPTGQYDTGELLLVHRIHELLARFEAEDVAAALEKLLQGGSLGEEAQKAYDGVTYRGQVGAEDHDDRQAAMIWVKRILNYVAPADTRKDLLDALYRMLWPQKESKAFSRTELPLTIRDFYLTPDEIVEMAAAGMGIGCHGRNHQAFSEMGETLQRSEIEQSFALLERMVTLPYRTFCYPYGGFHTFTDTTERLLDRAGVRFSFNVEERDITAEDIRDRPQALPRYDCNHFPHGAARSIEWQKAQIAV